VLNSIETTSSETILPNHFLKKLPDAEYYVVGTAGEPQPLSISLMSSAEAARKYGPYLTAKTFDLVVAGLEKLYGSDLYRQGGMSSLV
jgi:hypothetical protein